MGNMIILKNITRYEERDVAKTNLISTVCTRNENTDLFYKSYSKIIGRFENRQT